MTALVMLRMLTVRGRSFSHKEACLIQAVNEKHFLYLAMVRASTTAVYELL